MKVLAAGGALCLGLALSGTAFAQTTRPGYSTGASTGAGATVHAGVTTGTGATTRAGTSPGVTTRAGATTGLRTGVTTQAGTATNVTGMASGRTSGFYTPTQRASVVPANGVITGRTVVGANTVVTYSAGGTLYTVTYYPSGRYTYTTGASTGMSPTTYGGNAMAVGTGNTAATYSGGATLLPRTGGGDAPGVPTLPAILGLLLAAGGVLLRRLAAR